MEVLHLIITKTRIVTSLNISSFFPFTEQFVAAGYLTPTWRYQIKLSSPSPPRHLCCQLLWTKHANSKRPSKKFNQVWPPLFIITDLSTEYRLVPNIRWYVLRAVNMLRAVVCMFLSGRVLPAVGILFRPWIYDCKPLVLFIYKTIFIAFVVSLKGCGGVLNATNTEQTLTVKNLTNNTNCEWVIIPPQGQKVTIRFPEFNVGKLNRTARHCSRYVPK